MEGTRPFPLVAKATVGGSFVRAYFCKQLGITRASDPLLLFVMLLCCNKSRGTDACYDRGR